MTDNETLADIAREMRTYFQTQKRNGNPEHRPWHKVLSDWADRIEAATAEKSIAQKTPKIEQSGNAAALREALTQVKIGFDGNVLGPIGDVPNDWEIAEAKRLCKVVDSALAAQLRNCDRFANAAQALGAYPDGPPIGDDWDDADWMMLLDWLFAKAKEAQP